MNTLDPSTAAAFPRYLTGEVVVDTVASVAGVHRDFSVVLSMRRMVNVSKLAPSPFKLLNTLTLHADLRSTSKEAGLPNPFPRPPGRHHGGKVLLPVASDRRAQSSSPPIVPKGWIRNQCPGDSEVEEEKTVGDLMSRASSEADGRPSNLRQWADCGRSGPLGIQIGDSMEDNIRKRTESFGPGRAETDDLASVSESIGRPGSPPTSSRRRCCRGHDWSPITSIITKCARTLISVDGSTLSSRRLRSSINHRESDQAAGATGVSHSRPGFSVESGWAECCATSTERRRPRKRGLIGSVPSYTPRVKLDS